jgi:hypothetical protein
LGTNSVDGTKIAMGSDERGDILYHGATDYARLAKGTSGQVLTMGANDPAWATAAAGGSWTLIGSQAITNSLSVTQTGLTSTYDTYVILLSDLLFDTNNDALDVRLGDSSGIDSGGTDYQHCSTNIGSDDSTDVVFSDGDSKMRLLNNIQDTTAAGAAAIIYLHTPTDGVTYPHITFHATGNYGNKVRSSSGAAARKAVIAVDRVNIFCYYDNGIISGRMSVYGIKHT